MRGALLIVLLLCGLPAWAGEVVFYRCTDASGALTVQNMPCPKGMQQSTKVMQAVQTPAFVPPPAPAPPTPSPVPTPATGSPVMDRLYAAPEAAASAAKDKPVIAVADPVPLPPLYQCTPRDVDPYLSETAEPPGRCIAMRVTGLDGNPRTGAGEACEVIRDTCTPIDAGQQCTIWRKRVLDAEAAWRFASSLKADQLQQEYQRLKGLLDASACATQNP